ncbi:hypothetical protein J3A83DRAFT_4188289 [Scleroderma citrinum]
MAGGCSKKKQKNISGLDGQQQNLPEQQNRPEMDPELLAVNLELEHQDDDNIQGEPDTYGLKTNFKEEYDGDFTTDESDVNEEVELGHLNDEEFSQKLAEMVARKDVMDLDWMPEGFDLESDEDQSDSEMLCRRSSCSLSHLNKPNPQISNISGSGIDVQLERDLEEVAENEGDSEDWEDELKEYLALMQVLRSQGNGTMERASILDIAFMHLLATIKSLNNYHMKTEDRMAIHSFMMNQFRAIVMHGFQIYQLEK